MQNMGKYLKSCKGKPFWLHLLIKKSDIKMAFCFGYITSNSRCLIEVCLAVRQKLTVNVFRATTRKNKEIRGSQKTYPMNRKIRVSARFLCQPACHPYFNGLRAGFLCRKESGDKNCSPLVVYLPPRKFA